MKNENQEEIKYLLNSHHELIKAIKKTNDGIMQMNILIRELISVLRKNEPNQK